MVTQAPKADIIELCQLCARIWQTFQGKDHQKNVRFFLNTFPFLCYDIGCAHPFKLRPVQAGVIGALRALSITLALKEQDMYGL